MSYQEWRFIIRLGDIFHNNALTFTERRDAIAFRLQFSRWNQFKGEMTELSELIEDLGKAETVEEFDEVWSAIYDEADADRAWIDTQPHWNDANERNTL